MSIQTDEDPKEEKGCPTHVEELIEAEINGMDLVMKIEATLPREQDETIIKLLTRFKELFAWRPNDMPDIATSLITHEFNIDPLVNPIARI